MRSGGGPASLPVTGSGSAGDGEPGHPAFDGADASPLRDVSEPCLPGGRGFTYAPAAFPERASPVPTPGEPALPPVGIRATDPPAEGALAPLGQFLDSYILARDGDGLLIVDQHAAHERVLFERIMTRTAAGPAPAQRLLSPVVLELPYAQLEAARQSAEALAGIGFLTEDFGPDTILLRAMPGVFEGVDPAGLLRDVLSDLREGARPAEPEAARRRVAASAACHAAIKIHFPLTVAKMAWLLEALFHCESPNACPHGRPTVLRIEREDLERGFHRR